MSFFKNFFRSLLSVLGMEMEDDEKMEKVPIMYSNEKLRILLAENHQPVEEIFKKYIESLDYDQVPDFRPGMKWFNTSEPLSFKKHLKGKLVLLDFFTYCCINCMHILPDLKDIEQTYAIEDGLVVIGVHSAKFDNEKVADNVSNAVLRYNIDHPVVNDEGAEMWRKCDVHCWPTLLLISPEGRPLVMLMGEGHRETLKLYIKHFLAYFKDKISTKTLPLAKTLSSSSEIQQGALYFPGKIRAFEFNDQSNLCVSDSGNNRILFIPHIGNHDYHYNIITIGSKHGEVGFRDGSLSSALFNQPQGIAFLNKDIIFVADTENHAIRRIDLLQKTVSTVAGNGSQSNDRHGGRIGTQQGISSPWDVDVFITEDAKPVLLVAMAGLHQIWAVFLEDTKWWKGTEYLSGTVVCIAGSGREENRNNNYPNNAAFAQPSGLAVCQETKVVYVADSESSCVRKLSLADGKVSGVVGGDRNPNNLFAFGDKDGASFDAKLQHCIGIAMGNKQRQLFVADTYNHKIKVIDTSTNHVTTIKSEQFNEPCGLCQTFNGQVYVADTNNHEIKICTLSEDQKEIVNVEVLILQDDADEDKVDRVKRDDPVYTFKTIRMNSNENVEKMIQFHVNLDKLHWTEGAPQKWTAKSNSFEIETTTGRYVAEFRIKIRKIGKVTEKMEKLQEEVDVTFQVFTCLEDLCFNQRFIVKLPLEFESIDDKDNKAKKCEEDVHVNVTIGKDVVTLS